MPKSGSHGSVRGAFRKERPYRENCAISTSDRASCSSFWANQFRVLLTAAAYVLMQELRFQAAGALINSSHELLDSLNILIVKLYPKMELSVKIYCTKHCMYFYNDGEL